MRYLRWLNTFVLFLIVFSCNTNRHNLAFQISDPCERFSPTPDSLRYVPVYEKPIITSPDNTVTPIFYEDDVVEIKWESTEDSVDFDLEYFKLDHPYDCLDYEKFNIWGYEMGSGKVTLWWDKTLKYNYRFFDKTDWTNYFRKDPSEIITDTFYLAYRIRSKSKDKNGSYQKFSLWTDIKTVTVVPLVNLKKDIIEVSYTFNFITEETNEFYFSGIAKVNNYRLNNIASDYHLNFEKIKSIRPVKFVTNFLSGYENIKNPFPWIVIGFNEDYEFKKVFCPFEVLGSVSPDLEQGSRSIEGQFLQTSSNNFLSQMIDYDLKLAYKLHDDSGTEQEIVITLTYEVFSDY